MPITNLPRKGDPVCVQFKICRTKPKQKVKDCYTENLKTVKIEIKEDRKIPPCSWICRNHVMKLSI